MDFLTIKEFAAKMKMHPNTVRNAIKEGKIFASRPGSGSRPAYRIADTEIERIHIQSMCEKK